MYTLKYEFGPCKAAFYKKTPPNEIGGRELASFFYKIKITYRGGGFK